MKIMTNLKLMLIEYWYPKDRTDTDLAKAAGVDQSLVSRWISGKAEPTLDRKIKLAKVIGVDSRLIFPESK